MSFLSSRVDVLDGLRACSIVLVLAAHLLPLGPKSWGVNEAAGLAGMSIFFVLSGFLITRFLLRSNSLFDFVVRRFFRILPLAWLCILVVAVFQGFSTHAFFANALFFANLPPFYLIETTSHFWSLCVEVQFYVVVTIVVAVAGKRGLYVLPVLCLAVTAARVYFEVQYSIVTWFRIDEILAGCVLALIADAKRTSCQSHWLSYFSALFILVLSCFPAVGFGYFRPYAAAWLMYVSLCDEGSVAKRFLSAKTLAYFAAISYALYVIHPLLAHTWLGAGDGVEKYLKRPLLFGVLFVLAHLSTFYFERPCIDFGKRLSSWLNRRSSLQEGR